MREVKDKGEKKKGSFLRKLERTLACLSLVAPVYVCVCVCVSLALYSSSITAIQEAAQLPQLAPLRTLQLPAFHPRHRRWVTQRGTLQQNIEAAANRLALACAIDVAWHDWCCSRRRWR